MAKRGSKPARPGPSNKKGGSKGAGGSKSKGGPKAAGASKRKPAKPKPTAHGASKGKDAARGKGGAKGKPAAGSKGQGGKRPATAKKIARPGPPPQGKPRRPKPAADPNAVNLPPREEGDRLQKLLAAAGVASRRECELLIQEGRVEVDGEVVTELGRRVNPFKAKIVFDGEPLPKRKRLYFAVNKPEGIVCTARDPSGRQRVTDLLPPGVGRVFNVGRLDMASEGLILLTNDGELANQLTHPRHGVEKIYNVYVSGVPTAEALNEMRKGVYLAEGKAHFLNARVKSRRKTGSVLEVVLDEGRNREIRRVLARVGHKVQRLIRIAVGPVRLGEMPSGAYRALTPEEVRALRQAVKTGADATTEAPPRKPRSERGKPPAKPAAGKDKPATRRVIGDEETSAPKKPAGKRRPTNSKSGYRSTGKPSRPGKRPPRKKK